MYGQQQDFGGRADGHEDAGEGPNVQAETAGGGDAQKDEAKHRRIENAKKFCRASPTTTSTGTETSSGRSRRGLS